MRRAACPDPEFRCEFGTSIHADQAMDCCSMQSHAQLTQGELSSLRIGNVSTYTVVVRVNVLIPNVCRIRCSPFDATLVPPAGNGWFAKAARALPGRP
jgi:hypothetical protein